MPAKPVRTRLSFVVLNRAKGCQADITSRLEKALRLLDQATAAWKGGQREAAIKQLREAIGLEEVCLGAESPAVATALPQLGAYLLIDGQLAEAEIVLNRGIDLLAAYPVREKEMIAAKALLVELYLKTARQAEAEQTVTSALLDGDRVFGAESVEVVRLLHSLGLAREGQGDLGGATGAFGRALSICDTGKDRKTLEPMLPAILGSLVRLAFAGGQSDRAIEYLDRLLLVLPDDDGLDLTEEDDAGDLDCDCDAWDECLVGEG